MYTRELLVKNPTDHPLLIFLEPWGDEFPLPAGATLRFVGRGEQSGDFAIERDAESVTVYSWASSTCTVYDGEQILSDSPVAVPETPEGMSTRGFLGMVLGKPE